MEWLRWKLEMPNMVTVDNIGARGGLALFWKNEIDVTVKSFSDYHIDNVIKEEDGLRWRFTGIYRESRSEEKEATWELLRTLREQNDLPWLCALGISMKFFSTVRRKVHHEQKHVWRVSRRPWRTVTYMIWVTQGIHSHGVITITWRPAI
jgi:hypothetical protein